MNGRYFGGRKLTLISVSFKSVPVFISWILEYFKSIFSSIRLALKRMILRQFLKSWFVVLNIVQDVKIFDTLSKISSANLLMLQTSFDIKQTIDILDFTAAFYKLAQDVCKLVYSFYYRQNVINFNRLSLICWTLLNIAVFASLHHYLQAQFRNGMSE